MKNLLFILSLAICCACSAQFTGPLIGVNATTTGGTSGTLLIFYRSDLTTPYPGATPGTVTLNGTNSANTLQNLSGNFSIEFQLGAGNNAPLDFGLVHSDGTTYEIGTDAGSNVWLDKYNGNNGTTHTAAYTTDLLNKWITIGVTGTNISVTTSTTQGGAQTSLHPFTETHATGGTWRFRVTGSASQVVTNATKNP